MKNVSATSVRDVAAALHVFHRRMNWRSPWDGPAAIAGKGYETTSVVRALSPRGR